MVCVVTLMWFVGEGKGVEAWVERLFCRRWSQEAWMAWRDVTRVLGRGRWDWRASASSYQEIKHSSNLIASSIVHGAKILNFSCNSHLLSFIFSHSGIKLSLAFQQVPHKRVHRSLCPSITYSAPTINQLKKKPCCIRANHARPNQAARAMLYVETPRMCQEEYV